MNNKVYITLIVLLIALCAFLGYKISQKEDVIIQKQEQVEEVSEERGRLELELEKMKFSYDTLRTDNQMLSAEMLAQKEQVENLLKKVKNRDYDVYKIKKEAETLRGIMKGYVHQIDSLNQINLAQQEQIKGLQNDFTTVSQQKSQLEDELSQKEGMLKQGAILQAGGVSTLGIRIKSSGKQVETDRASKTEMIKSCFTLRKNTIAESGNKNLYLKIIAPDGKVLPTSNGAASGTFEGKTGNYSIKRVVNYNNDETDVCVFYTIANPDDLTKGNYTINIYEEESRIGQSTLALR